MSTLFLSRVFSAFNHTTRKSRRHSSACIAFSLLKPLPLGQYQLQNKCFENDGLRMTEYDWMMNWYTQLPSFGCFGTFTNTNFSKHGLRKPMDFGASRSWSWESPVASPSWAPCSFPWESPCSLHVLLLVSPFKGGWHLKSNSGRFSHCSWGWQAVNKNPASKNEKMVTIAPLNTSHRLPARRCRAHSLPQSISSDLCQRLMVSTCFKSVEHEGCLNWHHHKPTPSIETCQTTKLSDRSPEKPRETKMLPQSPVCLK